MNGWNLDHPAGGADPCDSTACGRPRRPARRNALGRLGTVGLWLAALGGTTVGDLQAAAPDKTALSGRPQTILIVGDSLSAEYGLARGTGWVALLERRLAGRPDVRVVNASVSGETTSGGAARLPALLRQHRPTHVVIELGGNDALRGQSLKAMQATLERMVEQSRAQGAQVLLVGMMVPPNFGRRYADDFAAVYPAVAKAHDVALVPFILAGVADRPDARDWFQADGIHPQAKAQPKMLDNVWAVLKGML